MTRVNTEIFVFGELCGVDIDRNDDDVAGLFCGADKIQVAFVKGALGVD